MALRPVSLLLLAVAVVGCDDDTTSLAGTGDLGVPGLVEPDLSMAATPPADLSMAMNAPADLSASSEDLAAPQGPSPLVVDDRYAASGFEGGGDVAGTIHADESCPMRASDGRGHCHHVDWTPGTNSWGGVVWQYPANNWGSSPGLPIPAGYAQVRFRAWGASGGEKVSFLAGLGVGGPDKFQGRLDVTLAAMPTLYVLGA